MAALPKGGVDSSEHVVLQGTGGGTMYSLIVTLTLSSASASPAAWEVVELQSFASVLKLPVLVTQAVLLWHQLESASLLERLPRLGYPHHQEVLEFLRTLVPGAYAPLAPFLCFLVTPHFHVLLCNEYTPFPD